MQILDTSRPRGLAGGNECCRRMGALDTVYVGKDDTGERVK